MSKLTTRPSDPEVHGHGPQEHSLCGLAPEAFESGDHDEVVVFAKPGQVVTCTFCRHTIDHVRTHFKGYNAIGKRGQ